MKYFAILIVVLMTILLSGCDIFYEEDVTYRYEDWLVFRSVNGPVVDYLEQDPSYNKLSMVGGVLDTEYIIESSSDYIARMKPDGTEYQYIVPDMGDILAISHDRQKFVVKDLNELILINIDGTGQQVINSSFSVYSSGVAFSYDNERIAYWENSVEVANSVELIVYYISTGQRQTVATLMRSAVSADGSMAWYQDTIYYTLLNSVKWVNAETTVSGLVVEGEYSELICSEMNNKLLMINCAQWAHTLDYLDLSTGTFNVSDLGSVEDEYALSYQQDRFIIKRHYYSEGNDSNYNENYVINLEDMSHYIIPIAVKNPSFDLSGEKILCTINIRIKE